MTPGSSVLLFEVNVIDRQADSAVTVLGISFNCAAFSD